MIRCIYCKKCFNSHTDLFKHYEREHEIKKLVATLQPKPKRSNRHKGIVTPDYIRKGIKVN